MGASGCVPAFFWQNITCISRRQLRALCDATSNLRVKSNCRRSESAAHRVLLLDSLCREVHGWLAAPASDDAAGSGPAWAAATRAGHRTGRTLMAVCGTWRRSVVASPSFFGRLLAPARARLPAVCESHGAATTWLTVDGAVKAEAADANPLSVDMAGGAVEDPLAPEDAAALWAALPLLPKLERLEVTRTHFGPGTPTPCAALAAPLNLRTLCLYRVAGLTADVLSELVAACPLLETLEMHHACPWRKLHARALEQRGGGPEDPGAVVARVLDADDGDDSLAAWVAGASMATSSVRTLRLGDGVDDSALRWVANFEGSALACLNVMHSYACDDLPASLRAALDGPRLLALSIHVDGRSQSADAVANVIAASASAASLRILYLADHVSRVGGAEAPTDTLTDAGLCALAAGCAKLSRLVVDDAGAITVQGAVALLEHLELSQLGLRRCFSAKFGGAKLLYDLADHRGVDLLWEPKALQAKAQIA